MNLVWDRGEVTVAEVWEALAEERGITRNTVQTLMTRLEAKGWLKHRTDGKTFHYSARRRRETVRREIVGRVVDTAFDGSVEGLVMALIEGRGLSDGEAERIRDMIDAARREDVS